MTPEQAKKLTELIDDLAILRAEMATIEDDEIYRDQYSVMRDKREEVEQLKERIVKLLTD